MRWPLTLAEVSFLFKRVLLWILFVSFLLVIQRLLFLGAYGHQESVGQLIFHFIVGMRFDLATLPFYLFPILVLLPFASIFPYRLTRFLSILQLLWIAFLNCIALASVYNFATNNKHLGWEFYAYIVDLGELLGGTFQRDPVLTILFFLVYPIVFFSGYRLFIRRMPRNSPVQFYQRLLLVFAIFVFTGVAFRGGFQQSPLRAADALNTPSAVLNNLELNGVFTVAHEQSEGSEFQKFYDDQENISYIQNLIASSEDFVSSEYPLVRYMPKKRLLPGRFQTIPGTSNNPPPNIVIILLESFTAKFLEAYGGDPRIAPNFNRISKNGLHYTRFFSTGGRSANGVFAIYAGLPDHAGRTILRSVQIQNRFAGLGSLLQSKGYSSYFVHGGDLGFDNLQTALPHFGIQNLIGKTEMEASRKYGKSTPWGFDDSKTFKQFVQTIHNAKRPYFATVFTLNTHHPFIYEESTRLYKSINELHPHQQGLIDYLNAYHQTDKLLGEFFEKIRQEKDFENTIFLLVADHTSHAGLDYVEDRSIPLVVYAPALIGSGINEQIAGQLDLYPTILALAGGDTFYAGMGSDLTSDTPGYAFFAGGSDTDVVGWIEGNRYFVKWLLGAKPALLGMDYPLTSENVFEKEPEVGLRYMRNALGMHQFVRSLEKENRIWPPEGKTLSYGKVKAQ